MNRIKIPGNRRTKILLLIILVIISILIIINIGLDNRKSIKVEEKASSEEHISSEEEQIDKVEEKNSNNQEEETLYNEAYSLFFQGNYSGSIEKANNIVSKFPESYKAYNIRGIAKAYSIGFEEGMKDIDKSLQIKGDYGYARFNKALNYELNGKYDESLSWYDKALEVENYMWSYYGKASIYGRRGDVENTILNLKKAIEVESAKDQESGIKKEARTEKDFDPVRGNKAFQEIIK
ncbi:hypothetical protein NNC19_16090 [Clostridium sp. SHJSY1]|uniref:tetratricopeptide repeat protein n=1 Tax=Clostridium sp. SHJSY1 TaxID=2942483 RepID=UPI002874900F|nr:tetratricopeptide repeat protein [Clostridium sp. SHJSY1]MDS0527213.1 hypothetical protein [Clostridium sp. SHJSY1]